MRNFLLIFVCIFSFSAFAQDKPKFDPEKYEKDLEAFVTKEAKLTQQEATAFFPLFREMREKQRDLFFKQRNLQMTKIGDDEKQALKILKTIDQNEIEIKKLQQHYHTAFLKVLPATKVLKCIKAEEGFNRWIMQKMAQGKHNWNKKRPGAQHDNNQRRQNR